MRPSDHTSRAVAVCVLALGLASCTEWFGHPPNLEMLAVRHLLAIRDAEDEFRRESGRYGSWDEISPKVDRQRSRRVTELVLATYEVRLEADATGYQVYTRLKRKDAGRRTFFIDQTGVLREAWAPKEASAASPVVR